MHACFHFGYLQCDLPALNTGTIQAVVNQNTQVWFKDLEQSKETIFSVCIFLQSADGDAQTLTEVDLFISTQRIKVLNADSQVSTSERTGYMFFSLVSYLICENESCLKAATELEKLHKRSGVVP